ncbi:MAG TPA: MATE family efflux transporter [Gemmataceae bacterium]|nr:MATE family efflux transporter [Gemmataceae bacterium]
MSSTDLTVTADDSGPRAAGRGPDRAPSALRALLALAWPLVVSNSFTTIQITIDRLFLSWYDVDAATAAVGAAMVFWLPFVLLWATAGYVATFAAQYTGARRPGRVGPAVWQGIYFSLFAGLAFLAFIPFTGTIFAGVGHSAAIQRLEGEYFRCLCWFALPALVTAALSAFFSGRGDAVTVIYINAAGTIVNAVLDYFLIFGYFGFPEMGIAGAGWATVAGAWASAGLALALMLRRPYRTENATLSGWRFDGQLYWRVMRYGIPSGVQWALDMAAFNAFVILIGRFGDADLGATGLVITINSFAFLPMLGVGQAVTILVGKHLGEDRPDLAERMTWTGLLVAGAYMGLISVLYVAAPTLFIGPFQGDNDPAKWQPIADRVAVLLWFVAVYSLFDAANIVLSFGLRGAGDTVFVSMLSLVLPWPVMVIPTWLAVVYGWGAYWAWAFASAYICLQAICFLIRFRGGKWRTMRVIEPAVVEG